MKNDFHYAAELIRNADGILITAGAGMSVDSGLPDFRSVGGLWNACPPLKKFNLQFMQIATPLAYQERPELAK
ncbi:NAD-dependent protein deacetylase [Mannheimia haemolytica]|nr:NAD-dependent deacetylase sirtuin 5 [Mannheimia haemolytica serotype A2 str. BOVINE]SQE30945.1 NAD-dependent deacetylase [Mannheimia haemolytica]